MTGGKRFGIDLNSISSKPLVSPLLIGQCPRPRRARVSPSTHISLVTIRPVGRFIQCCRAKMAMIN